MAIDSVVRFWQKVQEDPGLQRQVRSAQKTGTSDTSADFEKLATIAKAAGFDCTREELQGAESVTRFWMRVLEDEQLQQELLAAEELPQDQAIQLIHKVANKAGFNCTLEQLDVVTKAQAHAAQAGEELSEGELDSVAGGLGAYSASSFAALSNNWGTLGSSRIGPVVFKYYR